MRRILLPPLAVVVVLSLVAGPAPAASRKPNIIFIMADDLGSSELGCYGQKKIRTPNIDRMAREGLRFTRCYAGGCVCAPSRSCLMTGLHLGHAPIRANGGGMALADADVTVAEVLKKAGYATGCFGKWGLGVENTSGHPNRQGFDEFFGYLHQVHAHFFYPYFLWKDETKFPLKENEGKKRARYSHDEIHKQALSFIRRHKGGPFFCYVPYTIPHVELVVPEDSEKPYRGKWEETPLPDPRPGYIGSDTPYATFAGMVSRMDGHVGEILALLKELEIDEHTVVVFTSDNGAQGGAWKRLTDFFEGNGSLRGYKGSFYEGGIRTPMIVRWPGKVRAGSVSDHVCAFWDVLPTLADLAGAEPPEKTDGISFAPTLLGKGEQKKHDYLYWEMGRRRRGLSQAIRMGDWKYLKAPAGREELYDLKSDPGEKENVAEKNPDVVKKVHALLDGVRTEPRKYPAQPSPKITDFVR